MVLQNSIHDSQVLFCTRLANPYVAIVEHYHVVSCRWAVTDADSNIGVSPFILHELAAQIPELHQSAWHLSDGTCQTLLIARFSASNSVPVRTRRMSDLEATNSNTLLSHHPVEAQNLCTLCDNHHSRNFRDFWQRGDRFQENGLFRQRCVGVLAPSLFLRNRSWIVFSITSL